MVVDAWWLMIPVIGQSYVLFRCAALPVCQRAAHCFVGARRRWLMPRGTAEKLRRHRSMCYPWLSFFSPMAVNVLPMAIKAWWLMPRGTAEKLRRHRSMCHPRAVPRFNATQQQPPPHGCTSAQPLCAPPPRHTQVPTHWRLKGRCVPRLPEQEHEG